MTHLRQLSFATLSALFFGLAQAQEIAWIEQIEDPAQAVSLHRAGNTLVLQPYTPLRAGDEIQIGHPGAAVVIGSPDGRSQRITAAQSPFRLNAAGNSPTVTGNALRWVHGLFAGKERSANPALRSLSVRSAQGKALDVPYLSEHLRLLAGRRPLYVSWVDGRPPYRIRLIRELDSLAIVTADSPTQTSLMTPEIDFLPGEYRLEISDHTGTTYETRLEVMPVGAQPVFPDAGALASLTPEMARLVQASWLASVDDGHWVMESMQQLHALQSNFPAATEVLTRVGRGVRLD